MRITYSEARLVRHAWGVSEMKLTSISPTPQSTVVHMAHSRQFVSRAEQPAWLQEQCVPMCWPWEDPCSSSELQPWPDAFLWQVVVAKRADLAGDGGDDGLCMDQRGVAQIVQATAAQDLGTGLPPHGLTKLHQCKGFKLDPCQHSPAPTWHQNGRNKSEAVPA